MEIAGLYFAVIGTGIGVALFIRDWLRSREDVLAERVSSIEKAIEAGTREHEIWREKSDKQEQRLDQLMLHLLKGA